MGQPQTLRRRNRREVLERLLDLGPATRPQLAEHTGLSKVTVNAIVGELQGHGLVRLGAGVSSTPGRTPQAVHVAQNLGTLLVLDVQPAQVRARALGLGRQDLALPPLDGLARRRLTPAVGALIQDLAARQPFGPLRTVVVGLPAPVDGRGEVGEPNAAAHLELSRLRALGRSRGFRLVFENDANLVALGVQHRRPELRHLAALVERCSGTGLGLVLSGELYRGAAGLAGEIGRSPWPLEGAVACLETLPTARRLEATAFLLAGLTHALDLQHVLVGLSCPQAEGFAARLAPLLAPGVTLETESDVSTAALEGAAVLARQSARDAVLARAEALIPGGRHVA